MLMPAKGKGEKGKKGGGKSVGKNGNNVQLTPPAPPSARNINDNSPPAPTPQEENHQFNQIKRAMAKEMASIFFQNK